MARSGSLGAAALSCCIAVVLAGCGGGTAPSAASPAPTSAATAAPAGASAAASAFDMAALEKAAKAEGAVTLYSAQTPAALASIKKAFEAQYPGITLTPNQQTLA